MIEIPKNSATVVRLDLSEYQGMDRLDVREFLDLDGSGPRPTRKGINLPVSRLPELRAALQELEAEALRRGLLEPEPA